jgi:hypothetical protein
MYSFLIFCSGADKQLLSQSPQFERNKYASIGATIFLTGLLAAISGGYALYTVFRGEELALIASVLFGLVWAMVIFNLDRYIVSSLRKEGDWKKELLYATPRFIIAILISIVIAKPLEVRIFSNRIEQQILEDKRNKLAEEKLDIDKLNDLTKLENMTQVQDAQLKQLDSLRFKDPPTDDFRSLLQSRISALADLNNTSKNNHVKIAEYNQKINNINNNTNNYKKDSLGIPTTLRPEFKKEINDLGNSRNILVNEIKIKQKKVEDIDTDIKKSREDYQAQITQKIDDQNAEIEKTKQIKAEADSMAEVQMNESQIIKDRSYTNNFITQVEALGHLNSERFTTMWWTSILIMLLFMTIETAPIVVKLLTKRGPYDELLTRVEYQNYIDQQKIVSELNEDINSQLETIHALRKVKGDSQIKAEKDKINAELNANSTILDEIAKRQGELAKIAIEKWYQEELTKLNDNSNYQYINNKPQKSSITIEEKLWKTFSSAGQELYLFQNGQPSKKELLHIKDGIAEMGSWDYTILDKEIKITISNGTEKYLIEELTENSVKLKTSNNIIIDLIKA